MLTPAKQFRLASTVKQLKKKFQNDSVGKSKRKLCCRRLLKKTLLAPSFKSVRFPTPQIFVELFCTNLHYRAVMLVYLRGTPTWRPENDANIWNFLWLFT